MGLVDKLKLASSTTAVETLLIEGNSFALASGKTKRRWKYVATRRLKELQLAQEKKVVSEKKAEKTEVTKKPQRQKPQ